MGLVSVPLCTLWSVGPRPHSWVLGHQHHPTQRDRRHPGSCQLPAQNPVLKEYLLRLGLWFGPFIRLCQSGPSYSTDALRVAGSGQVMGLRSLGQEVTEPGQAPALAGFESFAVAGPSLSSTGGGQQGPRGLESESGQGLRLLSAQPPLSVTGSIHITPPSRGSSQRSLGDVPM